MATQIFRCLETVELDTTGIASGRIALAKAIAKIYNDIKHYDRFAYPPGEHSYFIGKIAILTVRLLSLRLFAPLATRGRNVEGEQVLLQAKDFMDSVGVAIDEGGNVVRV